MSSSVADVDATAEVAAPDETLKLQKSESDMSIDEPNTESNIIEYAANTDVNMANHTSSNNNTDNSNNPNPTIDTTAVIDASTTAPLQSQSQPQTTAVDNDIEMDSETLAAKIAAEEAAAAEAAATVAEVEAAMAAADAAEKEQEEKEDKEFQIFSHFSMETLPITVATDEKNDDIEIKLYDTESLERLKLLVWGSDYKMTDIQRWYSQGFGFVPLDEMRFGLLQLHGGPCGILSAVQGFLLRELIFDLTLGVFKEASGDPPLQPTDEQRETALIRALSNVLCRCAVADNYLPFVVGINSERTKFFYIECSSSQHLQTIIKQYLHVLQSNIGVVCFLFSMLMARTCDVILTEVDDQTQPLVLPEFGHCSQELVNLVITGRAVTNVHDGDKVLGDNGINNNNNNTSAPAAPAADEMLLQGIGPDQDIGFLSTLEVMRYTKVGDHYKNPKHPIWVVSSASHYSVLFGMNERIGKISEADKLEQEIKRKFNAFDPEENGFIMFQKAGDVFVSIEMKNVNIYSVKFVLDPDNTGVVTWNNFYRAYTQIRDQAKWKWGCQKCTFHNKMDNMNCDMCNERKPMHPQLLQDEAQNANDANSQPIPRDFILYHFNGLRQTKKDRPSLTKLHIFDEAEIQTFVPPGLCEELSGLIKTKWPYALVEYTGPFAPKIG